MSFNLYAPLLIEAELGKILAISLWNFLSLSEGFLDVVTKIYGSLYSSYSYSQSFFLDKHSLYFSNTYSFLNLTYFLYIYKLSYYETDRL